MAPLFFGVGPKRPGLRDKYIKKFEVQHCAQTRVRLPHPKIGKLACQAQGVGIFAAGELPVALQKQGLLPNGTPFLWSRLGEARLAR